ncbi:hypothetical protein FMLHJGGC_00063 [Staphylococcus phage BSwM-KMM1]|nr:hypothetical protein FMLHJGGC_00063 [Pseudomonas phage BSwM KMM1]
MIIVYVQERSKDSLSTLLRYINNKSSRDFTYSYGTDKYVNEKVDVNIVMDRGFDSDDVQELSSLVSNNNVIHVSIEPNRIVPYRKGEHTSVLEFEEFIKEM